MIIYSKYYSGMGLDFKLKSKLYLLAPARFTDTACLPKTPCRHLSLINKFANSTKETFQTRLCDTSRKYDILNIII